MPDEEVRALLVPEIGEPGDALEVLLTRRAGREEHQHRCRLARFVPHDLEPGEFDVLCTLRRSGAPYELTAGAFLRASLVTTGAITLRVDRMQAKGLVDRVRDTADRRSVKIRLTALGLEVVDRVLPLHLANEARLLGSLTEEDRRRLATTLAGLLESYGDLAPGVDG